MYQQTSSHVYSPQVSIRSRVCLLHKSGHRDGHSRLRTRRRANMYWLVALEKRTVPGRELVPRANHHSRLAQHPVALRCTLSAPPL